MVVVNYCEVCCVVEEGVVGQGGDGLFVCVDQIWVNFVFGGEWVDVEQVVFVL